MISLIVQWFCVSVASLMPILYLISLWNYRYWKKQGIPYEEPTFLFGNLTFALRKSFFDFFYELHKKYKCDYYGIFLAFRPALVVHSRDLTKRILVKDSDQFPDRMVFSDHKSDPLGALNLFTVEDPLWSRMRSEMSPMFTSSRLRMLTELMNINSTELVNKIQRDYIKGNIPVDLKILFSMYTSDTVGYTVFGLRVSALKNLASPLWHITQHMTKWTLARGLEFTAILFIPSLANLFKFKFFSKSATDHVKSVFTDVVEERQKMNVTSSRDLVTHLLNIRTKITQPGFAGPELADNLMHAQAAVFVFGSIETSSSTLSYLLHELAYHPEEQEKLYDEISGALKEKRKSILEYEDLLELKYLTASILETMRKYPLSPFINRRCNKTYKVNDDFTIEKGTPVYINVLALHHNEEYYPEPEKWRPERLIHLTENSNNDFTLLPFGEGPRFCIGKRYGMMQIRTAVAQMVANFRFEPAEPYLVESDPYAVFLAPKSGGKVKFVPRNNKHD